MDYQNYNDYELIYLVEEENEDAFLLLFKKYQPFIRNIVGRFYRSLKEYGVEYDDLYQEAYLAFVKAIKSFNNEDTIFYTFLNMSIKNKLLNYRKVVLAKKGIFNANMISLNTTVFDGEDNTLENYIEDKSVVMPIDCLQQDEFIQKLKEFCFELPSTQGQIFELICNGFANQEIACLLEIPTKIVSNTLYKIRKKLKLYLAS